VFVSCGADWGDVVSVDDERGGRLGTTHLIESGHRRVAYLSIPELEDQSDRARWEGYCEALSDAGLGAPMRISWSPPADQAVIDGLDRPLLEVFTGPERATAVFASNDVAAIALQEFADRVGYRVPEDISIVASTTCRWRSRPHRFDDRGAASRRARRLGIAGIATASSEGQRASTDHFGEREPRDPPFDRPTRGGPVLTALPAGGT